MGYTYPDEPDHPVLPDVVTYELIALNVQLADECAVELTLRKEGVVRRLLFRGAQDIRFEQASAGHRGLLIKDVSGRRLDAVRLYVFDSEQDDTLSFWARDVVEIES